MATTKNNKPAKQDTTAIIPAVQLNREATFDTFDQMEFSDLQNETGDYVKFSDGETYVFALTGISEIEIKDEKVPVACLTRRDGSMCFNGDKVMFSTAQRLKEAGRLPCMIKMYVDGVSKSSKGEYLNLKIYTAPDGPAIEESTEESTDTE